MKVEARLKKLDHVLPKPLAPPPGVEISFAWGRRFENRIYISGHGPQNADGSLAGPFGKVGAAISPEQAAIAARLATRCPCLAR